MEPTEAEVAQWLREWGLDGVVARDMRVRACQGLRLIRFGQEVDAALKREVFHRLAPVVHRLAVTQYELGEFRDPCYDFGLELCESGRVQ